MFNESFNFASRRSPSFTTTSTSHSSPSVSPCTSPTPSSASPAPFTVSDLTAQFAGQRIERQAQICYDSCQSYSDPLSADDDEESGWLIPPPDECDTTPLHRAHTFPIQRPHSPSRRAQRQANTRLLCSASHRDDIAALMSRMVAAEDQCLVAEPSPIIPPSQEDEGYNSSEDSVPATSRNSSIVMLGSRADRRPTSDLIAGGACVHKSIRLRKNRHHRRVRTADTEV